VVVGEDLDFDVARDGQVALEENRGIPERCARLALRGIHRLGQTGGLLHHPHPLATTAGGGLHQDREDGA
jgi:hypothetical protein